MADKPKLIGLDLDGTVVGNDNQICETNLCAIRSCHERGIHFAFLTGRRPLTAKKHLDTLGIPGFVATNSGCLLWEYPEWKQLERRMFPQHLLLPIAAALAPHSANFHVDSSETGFEFIHLERDSNPALDEYMVRYGKNTKHITDPQELTGFNVTQIAMPAQNPEVVRQLRKKITTMFKSQVLAMAVRWPLMDVLALELFNPEANKGSALADFARRSGLTSADCLAAGDDVNDIPMLTWAGTSLAMPQAGAEVVAVANHKLEGNGVEALGQYLQKVVLGE